MNRNIGVLVTVAALIGGAACNKGNEKTTADTMKVRGADTVSGGNVVPTTDTIVKKTTVTTDTLKGAASDSAKARAESLKTKKATKTKTKAKNP